MPILNDLPPILTADEEKTRPFTLFLNFQPIANAVLAEDGSFSEVWLYPGRSGKGPCEWGYCVAGEWCIVAGRKYMDPQPTHFAYATSVNNST